MLNKHQLQKYYSNILVVPVNKGMKDNKDKFFAYRRYTLRDIKLDGNIAIQTGMEVFKNRFLAILDVDFDMNTKEGDEVLKVISKYCSNTVIVKSGGKHNGLHVYYLTNEPVASGSIITKYGILEIKGINANGRPSVMMLPPSVVLKKYMVMHPQMAEYIDFKQVKQLSVNQFKELINNIKSELLTI